MAADVGQALRCAVIAAGVTRAESRTAFVPAPRNLVAPAITGNLAPGSTLTCGRGSWDEPNGAPYTAAYAWTRDGAAAGTERTIVTAGVGAKYVCTVTVAGTAAVSAEVTTATTTRTPPYVSGTPRLGATLTCEATAGGPAALAARASSPATARAAASSAPAATAAPSYAWQRGTETPVAGQTRAVGVDDLGQDLRCSATEDGVTLWSAVVVPAPPTALAAPEITGVARLGRTLTCSPGTWDGDYTLTREWTTRVIGAADLGRPLTCSVSVAGVTATSAKVVATAPVNRTVPALTGDPRVGGTLTCGAGGWDDDYPVTQHWFSGGSEIATGATYVPGPSDATIPALREPRRRCRRDFAHDHGRPPERPHRAHDLRHAAPEGHAHVRAGDWDGSYAFSFRWLRAGD